MRRAILVLSLLALPLAAMADEGAKPTEAPAPDAKATEAAPAPAPDAKAEAVPAPAEEAKIEAKPAEVKDAAPAPAEAKKVLKVVKEAEADKTAPIPEDPEEVILLVEQLINAAKGGNWQLFVGLLLTLIVWVLRKFNVISFLPDKAVPWVSAAIGMVGYMGVALASGLDLTTALIQGFLTGAAAVGLWEMLGKHTLPKPKKAEG